MGVNNIIYLSETIIMLLCIITAIIIYKAKHKKGLAVFFAITMPTFITLFLLTFIFEIPDIKIEKNINIEIGTDKKIENPKAMYHFQNVTKEMKTKGKIDYSKPGTYKLEYEINTFFGPYTKEVIVTIADTTKPEIILNGEENLKISYKKEYIEPGFQAIDKYEGDLTDKVKTRQEKIDNNNINIIYEVQDSSGNKIEKTRKIKLIDDICPSITINGMRNQVVILGQEYKEEGATATDEIDGDLTSKIQIEGNVDTTKEGAYYITYKVSDNSGNEISNQRIVIVKKQEDIPETDSNEEEIGIIFLTFDDGPSSNITPCILDILKEKNIKATFFILNYNEEEEQLVKREYEEGHSIGIHGYSHKYEDIYQSEEAYMQNITKLQEKIKATTGYNSTITRFPGGSSNTISNFNPGIMTRLTKLVIDSGYKYFDWNVSSEDAVGVEDPQELYNNVINGISKEKRNFVLMHDFEKNEAILEALPQIIDYAKENGYVFEKITEETPMVKHRVFN